MNTGNAFKNIEFSKLKIYIDCLRLNNIRVYLVLGNKHFVPIEESHIKNTAIKDFVDIYKIKYPILKDNLYRYENDIVFSIKSIDLDKYSSTRHSYNDFILLASDLGVDGIEIMYREEWYINSFGVESAAHKLLSILFYLYILIKEIKPSLKLGINLSYASLDIEGLLSKINKQLDGLNNEFVKEFLKEIIYPFGSGINLENINKDTCLDKHVNNLDKNITSCLCENKSN